MRAKTKRRVAMGAIVAAAATTLLVTFGRSKPVPVAFYTAIRVFDGDTFETAEKQYIRLSGINAPETGMCGSREAKETLEKLVLGKPLYVKVLYHIGSRSMGLVYNSDGLVNAAMLASGWSELNDRDNLDLLELQKSTNRAREQKKGIFADQCTQTRPPNAQCVIKANVTRNYVPTYHLPGCNSYKNVDVQLHHGDQWFCTEAQAKKAGFRKAKTCPR